MSEFRSPSSTRRQLLTGTLGLAGNSVMGQSKTYAPRIVCNMYYYVQLFSTPFRFISSHPDPLKMPAPAQPAGPAPTGGTIWTREQWYTALSDVQDAGYRRLEMLSGTVLAKPVTEIQAFLEQYGLMINHVWHAGRLYPAGIADTTIGKTIELLDYIKPLKTPEFFFDPFGDKGPLSADEAKSQNRGLDRIGKEAKDRGMKLCVHNHEGPMRYGAKEWLGSSKTPILRWSRCASIWTGRIKREPIRFPCCTKPATKAAWGQFTCGPSTTASRTRRWRTAATSISIRSRLT